MPEKCHVIKCTKPAVSNGLCDTHRKRVARHGSVDAGWPGDWGRREKHSAYKAWCNLRRYHLLAIPESWRKDFWAFAQEVGDRPHNGKCARPDPNSPWGKDNFFWKVPRSSSADYNKYMRDWHKKSRAANPEYYADQYLRKRYGVSWKWYQDTFRAQGEVCAVCKRPEDVKILGRSITMPVDHDHVTGKVRGVICTKCNRGLGLFRDNVEVLSNAVSYLKLYR